MAERGSSNIDPLALAVSPNGLLALACAFSACDAGELVGRPAIFPLPRVGRKAEDGSAKREEDVSDTSGRMSTDSAHALGRAIAGSLTSRCSAVDALILVHGKSRREDKSVSCARRAGSRLTLHGRV